MSRKPRVDFPSAFSHLISRGNNRQPIYFYQRDYLAPPKSLAVTQERYPFRFYAYTMMTKHFHLLIETQYISQKVKTDTFARTRSDTFARTRLHVCIYFSIHSAAWALERNTPQRTSCSGLPRGPPSTHREACRSARPAVWLSVRPVSKRARLWPDRHRLIRASFS
jgi:REP element-mobilizing transposase RayT